MRKIKRKVFVFSFLTIFIIASNYYSYLYIGFIDGGISKRYTFETYDGKHQFSTMPGKGTDLATMERRFADFCKEQKQYQNTQLYRTFKRNPLKYWRWYEYFTHPRYKYEYKKPSKSISNYFLIKNTQ